MGSEEGNFRFNNIEFSDRVLLLEITPASTSNTGEDSNASEFSATYPKVKKIHIISLMLAYKSQFFYKLFNNGMKETQQKDEVALRINESEEAAFMDLLKFIYDHSVNASSALDLVGVLMAADKFEVPSCVKYCVDLLLKLPMSMELALVYLELPSSVMADEMVQTLNESAKTFIFDQYRDFTRSQEEAMSLPLFAVELVIGSDSLQVDSEDEVFDFILKWGHLHYSKLEERLDIITKLVLKFISLSNMSTLKLKEILDCSDLDCDRVWKPVVDALFSKVQDVPTEKYEHPRRIYTRRNNVKVVRLQLTCPRYLVYFYLTKKECADLVPLKRLYSEVFWLAGQKVSVFAQCVELQGAIGLYLDVMEGSESCTLTYGFSAMNKSSKEFTFLIKVDNSIFAEDKAKGFRNPFSMPRAKLISDESEYVIDGILHLRADITLHS